jgi:hypothetical protein
MNLNSIQALLDALKRSESDGGLPGDDSPPGKPIAAKISVMRAIPKDKLSDDGMDDMSPDDMLGDTDADADADAEQDQQDQRNADMVSALQEQYPAIYAKLDKQLGKSDSAQPDLSDTTDNQMMA